MKRLAILTLLALTAISSIFGCTSRVENSTADTKTTVITTIFAPYDFSREIAGGLADVSMLLPPGSESHSYEPSPQDIIKIQNCDVFIYVGGESDKWIEKILASVDKSKISIITLMDCVEAVEEEVVEGMQPEEEDDESGEDAVEYDEHVWTSPKNAILITEKITDALCAADSANTDAYRANAQEYISKLIELDADFQAVISAAKRSCIVFGDRFPFRYLAHAYGLSYYAAFPGCSTETEPSAQTIKFLIDKINEESIPVVFHIELSNMKMANTISEATGAKVMLLHSCHNITKNDLQEGTTYLELMQANAAALREALE
ncbi:MAG: metal ABC transporter substrate-binding protein [Eubacteriaceae bacterium]|nr:metal ABC transporter substrate-binding protein [Eubacteriaceae bacterium]